MYMIVQPIYNKDYCFWTSQEGDTLTFEKVEIPEVQHYSWGIWLWNLSIKKIIALELFQKVENAWSQELL